MQAYVIFGLLYPTQALAKAAAKEHDLKFDPETDTVELPFNASPKAEALDYINRCIRAARERGYCDSAEDQFTTVVERQDPPVEQADRPDPLEFDDAFEQMPLARQLHFAAIACENAREQLGRETRPPLAPQGYGGSQPRMEGRLKPNAELAGDDDLLS